MALFFKKMNASNKNKIQKFVFLSILMHIVLFVAWSSFALLNKSQNQLEIFIVHGNQGYSKVETKKEKVLKNKIKNKHKPIENLIAEDSPEPATLETTMNITPAFDSNSVISKPSGKQKGEIIETEFGTATGPKFLHREIPIYPQMARRLGKEGKVILKLNLNEKGELLNIEVIESAQYGFTESAIEAVKKSKFLPATKDGIPVACRAILTIRFVLKN